MIILDSITRTLSLVLDGAVAATESDIVVSYVEIDGPNDNAFTPATQLSTTNGATPVTILSAPGGDSIYLQLKSLSLTNNDDAIIGVNITLDDSSDASSRYIIYVVLQVLDTLQYIDTIGFRVIDANGKIKVTESPVVMSGSDGQLAASKGTIFTAVASCKLTGITLVSSDGGTYTINLYIKRGSTSRRIIPLNKTLVDDLQFPPIANIQHWLDVGDLVEGDASSASKVDYTVSVEVL